MRLSIFAIVLFLSYLVLESNSLCASDQVRDLNTDICQYYCPSRTFISYQGSENVCAHQSPIDNHLRPTPDKFSFILILNGLNSEDYNKTLDGTYFSQLSLSFGSKTISLAKSDYSLTFLDQLKSVIEISLHPQTFIFSYPATFRIEFPDTSEDNQTSYYFANQKLSTGLLPFRAFNSDEEKLLDFTSSSRLPIEIIWCAISLLNPYPVAYLYGKMYMQTFHLLQMSSVTFDPLTLEYFQTSQSKISGIKVPNLPSLLLYHSQLSSEWDDDSTSVEFVNRKNDLMMDDVSRKILEFNSFPLFLDNMGIEITLIVIVIIPIIFLEIIFFFCLSGEGEPGTFYKICSRIRTFLRYNFLLATILGAFPSVMFYSILQVRQLFIYGKSGHNLSNSIVALFFLVLFAGAFPVFLYKNLKTIAKIKYVNSTEDDLDYDEALKLEMYGVVHHYHKGGRRPYPFFTFLFMIKSTFIPLCIIFLGEHPIIQTCLMAAVSLIVLVLTIVVRPYKKIYFNIFLIGYEAIELIVLVILTVLAIHQKGEFFIDIEASFFDKLNFSLLIFWTLLPVWTTILGLCSFIEKIYYLIKKRGQNGEKAQEINNKQRSSGFSFRKSSKIVPVVSSPETDTNPNTQRNDENKKLIFAGLMDIGSTSSTTNLQFGGQTPRLDSTILGGVNSGGATSRTIITETKADENEVLFISANRRRIQKLRPRNTQQIP